MNNNLMDELKRIDEFFKSKSKKEIAEIVERNKIEVECKKTIFYGNINEVFYNPIIEEFTVLDQTNKLDKYNINYEKEAA
ncbi:MAG: hypothetical protein ACRC5T_11400 [Cetobacterium sp.]